MFVDAIAAISQRYDDTVRPLADDLRRLFGRYRPLQHRERLNIDHTLPDDDSRGMLRLCASKNNAPSDSPAIALNIACGAIKLGDSDPIDSWSDIGVSWAKATANWTNVAGNDSYVDCNKATDRAGTLGTGTVRVYLPRAGGKDPNVRSGETIAYFLDPNGVAVAAGSYLDDKIGSVRMWAGASGSVPGGWAIMNGSQGGSGLNANGRFLEGITSGSVGVAAASGTSASGTASITVGSATTGISISAHAATGSPTPLSHTATGTVDVDNNNHNHAITFPTTPVQVSTSTADVTVLADPPPTNTENTDPLANVDTADIAANFADHSISSITDNIANHSVTDSGHTHTASDAGHTHGPGTLEPQSIQLFLIERVS